MEKKWLNQKDEFIEFDVRGLKGNFFLAIIKKAKTIPIGEGIKIVQDFEPIPLYSSMENIGFEHHTEKLSDGTYHSYFYRAKIAESKDKELPFKPIVMPRYADVDKKIADLTVNFWDNIWNKPEPAIELKTKFLLSLSNAVGASRFRQATRELIKAYYLGVTVQELDELFALFIWNQGIGHFSSEIAPSTLFRAYLLIKNLEKNKKNKKEIITALAEKFGEKNLKTGFINRW